jgi:capsular polysaccharide biosynthesis protein
MKLQFGTPHRDDFIRALSAWQILLAAVLLGGLVGAAVYAIFPPPYRASATVVVDNNLEKSLPAAPDRDVFYFLARETDKLEAVAWSDVVLDQVAQKDGKTSTADLRQGMLELSQPSDGAWHFYAVDSNPKWAAELATAWADSFTQTTKSAIDTAVKLDAAQAALQKITTEGKACTENCQTYLDSMTELEKQIFTLENASLGINPNVQIASTQKAVAPKARISRMGNAVLAGAAAALLLTFLGLLLFVREDKKVEQG